MPEEICYRRARLGERMREGLSRYCFVVTLSVAVCGLGILEEGSRLSVQAIVVQPTRSQVQDAMAKGMTAAKKKIPPSQLYPRFGSSDVLEPHGFLLTKLNAVTVMTAHFALRSAMPSEEDLQRILAEPTLQVSVTIFGDSPGFARDSYVLLRQDDRLIKPVKVRFDARAKPTRAWPRRPPYRAIVVAWFAYEDFDPLKPTIISVFPGSGGETSFHVDFAEFP